MRTGDVVAVDVERAERAAEAVRVREGAGEAAHPAVGELLRGARGAVGGDRQLGEPQHDHEPRRAARRADGEVGTRVGVEVADDRDGGAEPVGRREGAEVAGGGGEAHRGLR